MKKIAVAFLVTALLVVSFTMTACGDYVGLSLYGKTFTYEGVKIFESDDVKTNFPNTGDTIMSEREWLKKNWESISWPHTFAKKFGHSSLIGSFTEPKTYEETEELFVRLAETFSSKWKNSVVEIGEKRSDSDSADVKMTFENGDVKQCVIESENWGTEYDMYTFGTMKDADGEKVADVEITGKDKTGEIENFIINLPDELSEQSSYGTLALYLSAEESVVIHYYVTWTVS